MYSLQGSRQCYWEYRRVSKLASVVLSSSPTSLHGGLLIVDRGFRGVRSGLQSYLIGWECKSHGLQMPDWSCPNVSVSSRRQSLELFCTKKKFWKFSSNIFNCLSDKFLMLAQVFFDQSHRSDVRDTVLEDLPTFRRLRTGFFMLRIGWRVNWQSETRVLRSWYYKWPPETSDFNFLQLFINFWWSRRCDTCFSIRSDKIAILIRFSWFGVIGTGWRVFFNPKR